MAATVADEELQCPAAVVAVGSTAQFGEAAATVTDERQQQPKAVNAAAAAAACNGYIVCSIRVVAIASCERSRILIRAATKRRRQTIPNDIKLYYRDTKF